MFTTAIVRFSKLLFQALLSPLDRNRSIGGAALLILAFPLFLLWQGLHWLGFLVDEIVFRRYRRVEIREPLFVIGPPRTGTTFLHNVLTRDATYTTFHLWECLFGLSITGRKICRGLARIDRLAGRPFGRLGAWLGRALPGSMDEIHPLSLSEPEEDFLCFLPLAACFLLIVPFPGASWLWRIARLDTDANDRERAAFARWYRRCIQKHLYVNGVDKRFLSKNASFCGAGQTLLTEFPDARILVTWRDPLATVPSQLSSLRPGLAAAGFRQYDDELQEQLVDLMCHYYEHIARVEDENPGRVTTLTNDELRNRLDTSLIAALDRLDIHASDAFRDLVVDLAARSRTSASRHDYSLEEFGLSEDLIRSKFVRVYARMNAS